MTPLRAKRPSQSTDREHQPGHDAGREVQRAGQCEDDPDGGNDEDEDPVRVQADQQDARSQREHMPHSVDVPPEPPSPLRQEVPPRERRGDLHVVPHEPPTPVLDDGHVAEDQILGGEHLVVPRHLRLGRPPDTEPLTVHMDRMTEPLEHGAHVDAVDRPKIVHVRKEASITGARSGDALTDIEVGREHLLDVALGRHAVVVDEQHLDEVVVQPPFHPQPPRVLEGAGLVRRPAPEIFRDDDELVRPFVARVGPRLRHDPDAQWDGELISADPADDLVHGIDVPDGGDLDDQQPRHRECHPSYRECHPSSGLAGAHDSYQDHARTQHGGEPCDEDQRGHWITALARDSCSA